MLARGIRSYNRPTGMEEAQGLAAQGAVLLAGGTRVLKREHQVTSLVDLVGLGLTSLRVEDEDLHVGATTPVQDVADSSAAHEHSAGLLPLACRLALPSRLLRGMATIGGEAVAADPDSELVAALVALNAVFLVAHPEEPRESPALRFLRDPWRDLAGGGVLRAVVIRERPTARRSSAWPRCRRWRPSCPSPSPPPVGRQAGAREDRDNRPRRAAGSDAGRRVEARAHLRPRRRPGDRGLARGQPRTVAGRRRGERGLAAAHGPSATLQALRSAISRARARLPASTTDRGRPAAAAPAPMPNFSSGRMALQLNGRGAKLEAEAGTTLLELLRSAGVYGAGSGCGSGHRGACAVLLDGRPVASCLTLAVQAQGRSVVTVEGLGSAGARARCRRFGEAGAAPAASAAWLARRGAGAARGRRSSERSRRARRARGPRALHALRAAVAALLVAAARRARARSAATDAHGLPGHGPLPRCGRSSRKATRRATLRSDTLAGPCVAASSRSRCRWRWRSPPACRRCTASTPRSSPAA